MMTESYGARLTTLLGQRGSLCVGIDPHPVLLSAWGLPATASGLERLSRSIVAALADQVPVFKPQSAFFEAYGSAGIAVLERLLADIAAVGALSILDVKRGDIGSTMEAYATAYLADGSPLAADAITLSPYLGFGTLEPAIELAQRTGRGVYVLTRSSNPEGAEVQQAVTDGGVEVAARMVQGAAEHNAGAEPLGPIGIIVGATVRRTALDFSGLNGSILAPGIGAQGATARDLKIVFGDALGLVLPSVSREIMRAGPDAHSLRAEAERLKGQMAAVMRVG
jgi:orotidine-5'-phosphate decarboxylase